MQRVDHKLVGLLVALAPLIGACSADLSLSANSLKPTMQRPDWLSYSGSKQDFTLRPVTANDLVGPQGQCAPDPLVAGSPPAGEEGSVPLVQGGIALQMTECDVVRRAGAPDNIQVGSNDRGEREAVLTYARACVRASIASRRAPLFDRGGCRRRRRLPQRPSGPPSGADPAQVWLRSRCIQLVARLFDRA